MKILVAEDDPIYMRILQSMLAGWGYEVRTVMDGESALAVLLAEDAPPMAVLDWMMPKMDGIDVCRQVRQQNRPAYMYLLLLTGKSRKTELLGALHAGADDYLTKPFEPQELEARLYNGKRLLELHARLRAAEERRV